MVFSSVGTPLVTEDIRVGMKLINPNSPFGNASLSQVPIVEPTTGETVATIVAGVVGLGIGALINYVVFCQALKRCR